MKFLLISMLLGLNSLPAFAKGGVDGGGGEIGTTPINEVVQLIQLGAKEFNYGKIFYDLSPYTKLTRTTNDQRLLEIIEAPLKSKPLRTLNYLSASNIEIKTNQNCLDNEGNQKDAVVVNADSHNPVICFSAMNISRLPKTAVFKEVLALFIHEISHTFGANEVEAQKLQQLALINMDVLYTGVLKNPFLSNRSEMLEKLHVAKMFIAFGKKAILQDDHFETCHTVMTVLLSISGAQSHLVRYNFTENLKHLDGVSQGLLEEHSQLQIAFKAFLEKTTSKEEFLKQLNKTNRVIENSNQDIQRILFNKIFY